MIRAEIKELQKLYTLNNCSVTRISGCYVDGEKSIRERWSKNFLAMDEEDLLKYLEIFKKCLSGGMEKNLFTVPVKVDVQHSLEALRDSKLKNEDQLDAFYERIIDTYEYVGNYLILVIHDVYDVPGKTSDNIENEDASDTIYEYMLACICPVNLSKPGLGYNREQGVFTHLDRDWVLGAPEVSIIYPAFNDRAEDTDAALLYVKNLKEETKEFIWRLLGYGVKLSHTQEKKVFEDIVRETLGNAELKEVRAIQQTVMEMVTENNNQEPVKLQKSDIENILSKSKISDSKMRRFEGAFRDCVGEGTELTLNNIANMKSFNVDTDNAHIRIKPEYADEVSIQEVDGRKCLVMNIIGNVYVNGIEVYTDQREEQDDDC